MMKLRYLWLVLILGQIAGCATSSFVQTGSNKQYAAKPGDCEIEMVMILPERPLTEVGICYGESFNELRDRVEHAYEKLKECACEHGGDLLLIDGEILRKGSGTTVSGKVFRNK
jgi:uncharacterized protein (DUF2126 family)